MIRPELSRESIPKSLMFSRKLDHAQSEFRQVRVLGFALFVSDQVY